MRARCGHGWCTWRWRAAIAVLLVLVFAPQRCPAGDIEALIEATREEQRFPGLDGHFAEWEQELTR